MNAANTFLRSEQRTLKPEDVEFVCRLVYDLSGIVISSNKQEMLYRRIMRRIRHLKLDSFAAYCQLLREDDGTETPLFINAITTNLTSFFREHHHFDYLEKEFIPNRIMRPKGKRKLRLWSAACSSGEEAYSLAIVVQKVFASRLSAWDVKILATDLDSDVLEACHRGQYSEEKTSGLSAKILANYFTKEMGTEQTVYSAGHAIKNLIVFKQLNLLGRWPMRGAFDVIMCRNVLIYFDKPTQELVVRKLYERLAPGGVLILGHSESLPPSVEGLEVIGRTIFLQKEKSCL